MAKDTTDYSNAANFHKVKRLEAVYCKFMALMLLHQAVSKFMACEMMVFLHVFAPVDISKTQVVLAGKTMIATVNLPLGAFYHGSGELPRIQEWCRMWMQRAWASFFFPKELPPKLDRHKLIHWHAPPKSPVQSRFEEDVGPRCQVNFFLVNMPASTPGQYGDYYCDANCVGGNCCAEFDINVSRMRRFLRRNLLGEVGDPLMLTKKIGK